MKDKKLCLLLIAIIVCSCGGGSSSGYSSYEEASTNYEYDEMVNDESLNNHSSEMMQQMYLCPMCQGNRQIRHYYTGEIMDCPACQGAGQVTAEIIQQLQEATQMGEDFANSVISGGAGGYSHIQSNRSCDDIEMELEQCEREKASIEEQMEYVESVTNRSYLSSQLTILNTRINQLKRELQYAD